MEYLWALILGFAIALILAFGIGANDVANSFGTSVGSKVLTLVQACIIATIFETLGAVLIGSQVSDTIRKGIIDVDIYNGTEHLLVSGEISALMGSAIWLILATFLKLPVSASHSVVGSTLGFSLVAKGHQGIHWEKLGYIVSSWFASPLLSGLISGSIFILIRKFVLNKDKSLKAALRVLPFIYASTFAVNLFSIFYNGPRVLKFDRIPVYGAFILTIGISTIIGLGVQFLLVPWYRRRIVENTVASVNLLKAPTGAGKNHAAGPDHQLVALQHQANKDNITASTPAPVKNGGGSSVIDVRGLRLSEDFSKSVDPEGNGGYLSGIDDTIAQGRASHNPFRALLKLWRRMGLRISSHARNTKAPSSNNDTSALRPLSACSVSTLNTNLSAEAPQSRPSSKRGQPRTTLQGDQQNSILQQQQLPAPTILPQIVLPARAESPKHRSSAPDTAIEVHGSQQHPHLRSSMLDYLGEDSDHLAPYHRERKLSDSDRLFISYIMPGQLSHFQDTTDAQPGDERFKVGSAYAPTSPFDQGSGVDELENIVEDEDLFEDEGQQEPKVVPTQLSPLEAELTPKESPTTDPKRTRIHSVGSANGLRRRSRSPPRSSSISKAGPSSDPKSPAPGIEEAAPASRDPVGVSRLFSFLQILTGAFGAFAHGGNDVSNSIGPLIALYEICVHGQMGKLVEPPLWILFVGGIGISLGLWLFGKPVMETMGKDLTLITPTSGFTIEIGAALTVLLASNLGIPISTTHCKVGSIVFVGYLRSKQSVDWKLFGNIVAAWIVTVPVSMALSASLMAGLRYAVK